jgi:N-acetylglutamate synthase
MSTAIAELERIADLHWRAPERASLGEWQLRAAGGFTGRANSALPLGSPAMPLDGAVQAVVSWYRERGLPPMITIPGPAGELDDFLAGLGWTMRSGAAYVMTARAGSLPAPRAAARLDASPDAGWLTLFRGGDVHPCALELLMSAPWQAFGSFRSGAEIRAVGRVSVAEGWGAITALEVAPAWRRRGLGAALTSALCAAAGADRILLQVAIDNAPAIALYEGLGFRISHRYHYRVAPA